MYSELRLVARRFMKNERQGNTLQTTALVNEVYLRLIDVQKCDVARARVQHDDHGGRGDQADRFGHHHSLNFVGP